MFLILLLFWLIFNGRVTTEILLVGAAVSGALTLAWHRCFNTKRYTILPTPGSIWRYLRYFGNLLIEIFQNNFLVLRLVLHPEEEIRPQLVTFHTRLKQDNHKVILANSITLTPGTITVALHDDILCVHGLDASFLEGIEECDMEKRLEKMEEVTRHE